MGIRIITNNESTYATPDIFGGATNQAVQDSGKQDDSKTFPKQKDNPEEEEEEESAGGKLRKRKKSSGGDAAPSRSYNY